MELEEEKEIMLIKGGNYTTHSTAVISAYPACGKSYIYNHYNSDDLIILDSDSSKFSWIYENGVKTDKRNPNFIQDYVAHIKENIGRVDIIFVSSHKEVRQALRDNKILYYMVYPSLDMKEEMLERMKQRGNDEKFIAFQREHYDEFINEIEEECKKYHGVYFDDDNIIRIKPMLREILTKKNPYITMQMLDSMTNDNSMWNLSWMWLNAHTWPDQIHYNESV